MNTPPINLDAQDLFQSHVAQVDLGAEVVQQRELARLVGGLEQDCFKAEGGSEDGSHLRPFLLRALKRRRQLC
jgi:hypothetical protein